MATTTTPTYEPCAECAAPLDDHQRYCVVCGTSRRHPADPVARYLSSQAAARRAARTAPAPVAPSRRGADNRWIAAALALLPLAAAIGVTVGKHDSSGSDGKLLAALRAQGPLAAGAAAGGAAAAKTALPSDFSLSKGYVVQIGTLPWATTTAASAGKAKAAARAKGAKAVGIINPDDFTLRPGPAGDYVLYSGQFKTRAQAQRALASLKHRFPSARLVKVGAAKGAGGSAAGSTASVTGAAADAVAAQRHPTAQQKAAGAKIVQEIQATKGQSYVKQQRKLPDTIVVP